jgi:hypothetical protein
VSIRLKSFFVILSCATILFGRQNSAVAAINIANGAPVIGGGGDYPGNPFNTGGIYGTPNVTDGQNAADPFNNSGTITEPGQDGSYWLGPGYTNTGYFVLDLEASYSIGQIELFNTRNGPYEDRGTGNFSISASNLIQLGPPNTGFDLLGGVQIASGTLTAQTYSPGGFNGQGNTLLIPDTATASIPGPFRYIRFDALSIGATNRFGVGLNGVGLNEIRIFEGTLVGTPEPGVVVVFGLVGGLGWLVRRRLCEALS